MRILLLNQFFWPDEAATSQFLTDLARHLAAMGHTVTVICGQNGYARWAEGPPPPVTIRRVPNARFARGRLGRVVSYASFLASAGAVGSATRNMWYGR